MEKENLSPELVDYIYQYQSKFMTEHESIAAGKVKLTETDPHQRLLEAQKKRIEMMNNEKRKQLLADGFEAFKNRVVNRIYSGHKQELETNLCPACGKIARTPLAKQCRFFFHDWH